MRERNGKRIESRKQRSRKKIGRKQMSKGRIHVVFQVVIPPTEQADSPCHCASAVAAAAKLGQCASS